ncbi:MAG: site-specific integrase [Clostridia bacterium]|nr:site-specific integrase [Clostridia bacterium]
MKGLINANKQNKVRGKSITRQLRDETEAFLSTKSFGTQKNYRKWLDAYIKYCREHHNCKTHDECFMHIQDYADYLQGKYSASTIHSYLAAVCGFYNVPMDLIAKPIRHTAEYTKSRSDNGKTIRADNNPDNPHYERSVSFQRVVGIRASELAKLEGRDLVTDESGHLCVFVKNGKGGKDSLQRILPEDEVFVSEYFNVGKKEKVFQPIELSNSIDYHHVRADNAKRCYEYYLNRINTEEGYAEKLADEIRLRWKLYCTKRLKDGTIVHKPFDEKLIKGTYKTRGKNKQLAIEYGLPTEYNNLALAAVSIFHLAHWRNNVTVQSYLLSH